MGLRLPKIHLARRVFLICLVLFSIGALALAGIALILDIQGLMADSNWVMDTQHGIECLNDVLSSLKDAETGSRGYLITGLETYLEPYNAAISALGGKMDMLRAQFADDAATMQQINRLDTMIKARIAILAVTNQLRRIGGLGAALPVVYTNVGKTLMDYIRLQVAKMVTAQTALLNQRQAEALLNGQQTITLAALTGILAILMLGFAFSAVIRQNHRSRLAESLAHKEKHFADQITETVPISIFIYDVEDRHFTFANQRLRELLSISADKITDLGEAFYTQLFDPSDDSARQALNTRVPVMADGETVVEELRVSDAHNAWHWIELRLKVHERLPDGKIKTVLATVSDLTQQKGIEQALRETNAFVERVTNSVPSLVIVYDVATYQYVFINQQARTALELFDQGGMQSPYKNLRLPLHPDDLSKHDECWQQLLLEPTRTIETELRLWGTREAWRWMSVRYLVLTTTPDGRPKQVLMTAWDITQQKGAEQQAGQLALETERSGLLKNFVETSSHDLNTPLTVAMTASYMIQAYTTRFLEQHGQREEQPDNTTLEEVLKFAKNLKVQYEKLNPALDRLKVIIANMLEMVQLDYDLKLNCKLIDLDLVVDQVVRQMRVQFPDQRPLLNRVPSPGLTTGCYDIDYMRRAIINILDNAIANTPGEGSVTVRTYERGQNLVIEIADTGIGIPEASLPHIFDRFYRVDTSRRSITGGNGLGLAIAKRIVEEHNGHIEVDSVVGKGSTFRIVVPIRY